MTLGINQSISPQNPETTSVRRDGILDWQKELEYESERLCCTISSKRHSCLISPAFNRPPCNFAASQVPSFD